MRQIVNASHRSNSPRATRNDGTAFPERQKAKQSGCVQGPENVSFEGAWDGVVMCKGGNMTIMVSAHADWASASVEAVEHLMEQLTVLGDDPASQAAQYHLRSGGSRVLNKRRA